LAQDSCMVRPSCADMGYTKSATDCEGKKAIACPFDLSAYYCPEIGESCDFSEYPLTECPTGGNCTDFECGGTTQFKLESCQSGYEINEDGMTCNACDFTGYTLSSCPTGGNCSNYSCGGTKKYKLNSCKSGYTKSGTTCTACSWGDYTLSSCPANGNCTSKTCGGKTQYYLSSCKSGYYDYDNTCIACSKVCVSSSCSIAVSYNHACGCYTRCCDAYDTNRCDEDGCALAVHPPGTCPSPYVCVQCWSEV